MNQISLLNWMLLSTALLGAWWGCYRVALRTERSFAYNRAFLVLGPVLAAGLPLVPLAWPASWVVVAPPLARLGSVMLPAVQVGAAAAPAGTDWAWWLVVGYAAGALLLLARLGHGLLALWLKTRGLPSEQGPDYRLVRTHGRLPTSSFGRVVLWDDTLPLSPAEACQVLRHELAHVRQGHTYDRLLLELLQVLLWFNPFVHLCGQALALTHEFLADAEALLPEADAALPTLSLSSSYTHLLARQVASRLGFSVPLAHSFSQSQTLRRIAMIQKTNPIRRWKQWLALPLLSALLFTVACEKAGSPAPPPPIMLSSVQMQDLRVPPPPVLYDIAEQMPELASGGGTTGIVEYLQRHISYPKVAGYPAAEGTVFAHLVVTHTGEVQDIRILKGLTPQYDAAVLDAVRHLPAFRPGRNGDKAVDVSLTLPVRFVTKVPASK